MPKHRGSVYSEFQAKCARYRLSYAYDIIKQNMREQHDKDVVIGILRREMEEFGIMTQEKTPCPR